MPLLYNMCQHVQIIENNVLQNKCIVLIFRLENEKWMNVRVGDIIKLENNQFVAVSLNCFIKI